MPRSRDDLPGTLKRSPAKVRRTYEKTLESAHEEYSSEERAHRTAWASVKHVAERKGDHWEVKPEKGPSDEQSLQHGAEARDHPARTAGGVDVIGHTKRELYERARALNVPGRSHMDKTELGRAIARRNG
jgi:cation transport regulator ChaB